MCVRVVKEVNFSENKNARGKIDVEMALCTGREEGEVDAQGNAARNRRKIARAGTTFFFSKTGCASFVCGSD